MGEKLIISSLCKERVKDLVKFNIIKISVKEVMCSQAKLITVVTVVGP